MKYILSLGLLALTPLVTGAATFHYVTSAGVTDSVEASDAQTALSIAPNIAANSGVALDRGLIEEGMVVASVAGSDAQSSNAAGGVRTDAGGTTFFYVNTNGVTDSVDASNANVALSIAPNIAANSGVALDQGLLEEGMIVPSVAGSN